MNRSDFRELAEVRVREARILCDAGAFDGAYYLAGYSVECALKACIARQTREFDFPDRSLVNQMYTHDLERLVGVAGLQQALTDEMDRDAAFAVNWAIAKDWTEEARYGRHEEAKTRELLSAVSDSSGVLKWLSIYW